MARNWPYMRVEDIAEKVAMGPFGSSIKVETFTPTGIPIVSGQHLHEAELKDGDNNFISTEHADALKNANVRRGDVIFTHAGNMSLSGILCLGHSMTTRSMYATQDEDSGCGRDGIAVDSEGID